MNIESDKVAQCAKNLMELWNTRGNLNWVVDRSGSHSATFEYNGDEYTLLFDKMPEDIKREMVKPRDVYNMAFSKNGSYGFADGEKPPHKLLGIIFNGFADRMNEFDFDVILIMASDDHKDERLRVYNGAIYRLGKNSKYRKYAGSIHMASGGTNQILSIEPLSKEDIETLRALELNGKGEIRF